MNSESFVKSLSSGEVPIDPILTEETEILIVGTYPSQISRERNQYYANPLNHFWKLMGHVLDVNLQSMDYDTRINTLLQHKIGLWDTINSCNITGSSDRSIRNEVCNDFSQLVHVSKIVCNGKKAYECMERCNVPDNIEVVRVPSSSPARAMKLDEKIKEWKKAIAF